MNDDNKQLDSILLDVGEFGRYQIYMAVLGIFVTIINCFSIYIYVFEATPINHRFSCPRCFIDECDYDFLDYNPEWLINAVPVKDGKPARCFKFQNVNNSNCGVLDFNRSVLETCERFIYETSQKSIMQDFDLHCDDKLKMLAFVGTINGIGKLVGLPLLGYFSDRLGRKTMLIWSSIATGVLGLSKSFSSSYLMFIFLEFLEAFSSSSIYPCINVLLTESTVPNKRFLMTTLQFLAFSSGGVIFGAVASQVQRWRLLLRILYPLNFLHVFYIWLMPESVRWLFVNSKYEKVEKLLRKTAKINKKRVTEEKVLNLSIRDEEESEKMTISLKCFLKSKILVVRCIICSFCWLSCIFVYYGLTINSITSSDNHYVEFMTACAAEIPAYILAYFLVRTARRKLLPSGSFLLSGFACIGFIVVPIHLYWVQFITYLIGKFAISIVSIVIYSITNELFPTSFRQTLFSICSMFGRIGNILAPQIIVLQEIWKNLPLVLFATFTLISAFLIIFLPETKNTIYPNTIEEAENIGKMRRPNLRKF